MAPSTYEDYDRSLVMVMQIDLGTVDTVPRAAQRTQKTTEFSITTFRYAEADIASFLASEENEVFVFRGQD